ncbi:DBH-like monooxygenase protein 1 [Orchesella cincta]|uniref:DBH-like monooxygenase protein 1 n=1 Tax=Orchesella cincta TaxID=48709 RepID=A0A1D2MU53_ORCCI|nr:DBH-like monooxygenase protein 1 [Orchesella cincta]
MRAYRNYGTENPGLFGVLVFCTLGFSSYANAYMDRHSENEEMPEIDSSQDWVLLTAWETHSHTFLSFSRAFDTCDPHDYVITEDRIALIWAFGEKDNEIEYHHQNRGAYNIHLIHPDYTPPITRQSKGITHVLGKENSDLRVWTISRVWTIPSDHTTYWCTMHSPPKLAHKHHVVGFEVRFDSEESKKHVHHIMVMKCNAPRGRSSRTMFESFLQYRGQQCLTVTERNLDGPMPTDYCTEMFIGWAIGSRVARRRNDDDRASGSWVNSLFLNTPKLRRSQNLWALWCNVYSENAATRWDQFGCSFSSFPQFR